MQKDKSNVASEAARFNERYSEPGYHYGTAPNAFIAAQKPLLEKGMRALLPGDGEGRNGVWLAEQGLEVTSFDPSIVGVEKARQLAAERGVKIDARIGDVESWTWKKCEYDVIVLSYVHLIPSMRARAHHNVWEALRPGGIVILEAFSPRQLEMRKKGAKGGPQEIDQLLTVEMLRKDFPAAEFLVLEEIEADFEGRTHGGRCAVTRMVARKRA